MRANVRKGADGLWYVNSVPCSTQAQAMERLKKVDPEAYAQVMRYANVRTSEWPKVLAGFAILFVIIAFLVWGVNKVFSGPPKEKRISLSLAHAQMQINAERLVRANLRDPDSAKFRNQNADCGEVNAKNGFGGFTGYRRYIASSKDLVLIEGEGFTKEQFSIFWQKHCR